MSKVCFLSWHFQTPEIFLDYLRPMSPGCSGKWKDMEAITDPHKADFCVIWDGYSGDFPRERAIYVGQHPKVEGFSPSFRTFEDKGKCAARIRLDKHLNPGEWWISYTYDQLCAMKDVPTKRIQYGSICVMTYQTHNEMYSQRIHFMEVLVRYLKHKNVEPVEIFGRPEEKFRQNTTLSPYYKGSLGHNSPDGTLNQHKEGKNIVGNYAYSFEFDVGPTTNYLSERFYDAILLYCLPLYFGSTNVESFMPYGSFRKIDIYDLSDQNLSYIYNSIEGSISENIDMKAITAARDLLLNKYQTFPYLYHVIHNLDKYQ